MSILIHMEMPEDCFGCTLQGNPMCIDQLDFSIRGKRPERCPLTEVPDSRWIPVTERLPEIECSYLIVDEHGEVHEAEYFNGEWVDPIEEYCVWNSKYWMSLPEPPKE